MTCQSSRVPTTTASASQVASPTRQNRRHAPGTRLPARRSSSASATMDASVASTPSVISTVLSAVGTVMKRVSTSMRALSPGCAATFRSVNTPATCGFFSIGTVPVAPGMPTKSAPTLPALAHRCSVLHAPACTALRGATAATESRNATTTVSGVGADEQAVAAGVDARGRDGGEHQAAGLRQRRDRLARDRRVERERGAGHQRRGDVGDQPVGADRLRPAGWSRWSGGPGATG